MNTLLSAIALLAGAIFIVFNRFVAERGIEFQQAVGSIWTGHRSLVAMRVGTVIMGAYAIVIGILVLTGRLSFM